MKKNTRYVLIIATVIAVVITSIAVVSARFAPTQTIEEALQELQQSIDYAWGLLGETHVSETNAGIPIGEYWAAQQTHDDLIAAIEAAQIVFDNANGGEQGSLTLHLYDDSGKPVYEAEIELFVNLVRTIHQTQTGVISIKDIPEGSSVRFSVFSEQGEFSSPVIYPFAFEHDGYQIVTLTIKPPVEYYFCKDAVIWHPGEWCEDSANEPIEFPVEWDGAFGAAALETALIEFHDEWIEIFEDTPTDILTEWGNNEPILYTSKGVFETDGFGPASVLLETWNLTPHLSYITVPVEINMPWHVTVSSNAVQWLSVDIIRAFPPHTNGLFYIDADVNLGNSLRTGTVTIHLQNGQMFDIVVNQAAGFGLVLSSDTWNPPFAGVGGIFYIYSNRQWNVSISNNAVNWLLLRDFYPPNRTGDGGIAIEARPNFGDTQREGVITVTAPGTPLTTRRIDVTQGTGPILISPTGTLNMPEHVFTVGPYQVESNRMWTATVSDTSWLTVTPAIHSGNQINTGLFNGSFTITTRTANLSSSPRTGTIRIAASGAPNRDITVIQAAGNGLVLSGNTMTAPSANANFGSVEVFSNRTWTASVRNNAQWLRVTPSSGSNNGTIRIDASANFGAARTGFIDVTAGTVTRTVTVTQPAGAVLWLSGTLGEPCPAASAGHVDVISNRTWTAVSNAPSWLVATPATHANDGSFSIITTEHFGPLPRIGTITVTTQGANSQTETVRIVQGGRTHDLTLSENTWNPPPNASSIFVNVRTTANWTVTSSHPAWLSVNRISPDMLRISTLQNTGNTRHGTIYVTANGAPSRKINVTQARQETLSLSATTWIPTSAASNATVHVTSNTSWAVSVISSEPNWLTVNRTSGNGNGTFVINATRNPGDTTRLGRIIVTGGGITQEINVTQLASPNNIFQKAINDILNGAGHQSLAALQDIMYYHQIMATFFEGESFTEQAAQAFLDNLSLNISGFIHGQRVINSPQSNLVIGTRGNGADHGCGPISAYNALHSLSQAGFAAPPCIAVITNQINLLGGFNLRGELGTNPLTVYRVIRNIGVDAHIQFAPTGCLDTAILRSRERTAILLYVHGPDWHYIMVRHDGTRFELYNEVTIEPNFVPVDSVNDLMQGRIPLALITFPYR